MKELTGSRYYDKVFTIDFEFVLVCKEYWYR